jgi:hypothetical protein
MKDFTDKSIQLLATYYEAGTIGRIGRMNRGCILVESTRQQVENRRFAPGGII